MQVFRNACRTSLGSITSTICIFEAIFVGIVVRKGRVAPTTASMHDAELLQAVPLALPPTASRAKWFVAGVTSTRLLVIGMVMLSNISKPDLRSKVDAIDSTQLYSTIDST